MENALAALPFVNSVCGLKLQVYNPHSNFPNANCVCQVVLRMKLRAEGRFVARKLLSLFPRDRLVIEVFVEKLLRQWKKDVTQKEIKLKQYFAFY